LFVGVFFLETDGILSLFDEGMFVFEVTTPPKHRSLARLCDEGQQVILSMYCYITPVLEGDRI